MTKNNLTFSQRYGYVPLPTPMQLEVISEDLRRETWNLMWKFIVSVRDSHVSHYFFRKDEELFFGRVLARYWRKPIDEIDCYENDDVKKHIKPICFNSQFNKFLDFLEFIVNDNHYGTEFLQDIKELFQSHGASYRLDTSKPPYKFFPCSTTEQCDSVENALETLHERGMDGAVAHLRSSAQHINLSQYADSVLDSISAIESVAKLIDPNANNTLSAALHSLEKAGLLNHTALKKAFIKLYGYTSDEQGIRHALYEKDSPDVGLDEALFMYGACASFAAYLVEKNRKMSNPS